MGSKTTLIACADDVKKRGVNLDDSYDPEDKNEGSEKDVSV